MDNNIDFLELLKNAMAGRSQAEFARISGLNRYQLNRLINHPEIMPREKTLKKLADASGIPFETFREAAKRSAEFDPRKKRIKAAILANIPSECRLIPGTEYVSFAIETAGGTDLYIILTDNTPDRLLYYYSALLFIKLNPCDRIILATDNPETADFIRSQTPVNLKINLCLMFVDTGAMTTNLTTLLPAVED